MKNEFITVQQVIQNSCKKIGKSQIKVAKDLKIPHATFNKYGKTTKLSLSVAESISEYFSHYDIDIDPIWLLRVQAGQILN